MAEIIQIDSHTWRFEDDFVRFFLLEGTNSAVLIDSGVNCPDAIDLAKTLTNKKLMLLNTHGDGDHTSGTEGFPVIRMHFLDYIQCGIDMKYPETDLKDISDGDAIDLGQRQLRIIHIPGHTAGSVAILDIKNRVLYAGDTVQKGHIYMFGDHRVPEQYTASLDKLIAMKDKYDFIYASHDEFCLPNDYTEKIKTVWQQVINEELPFEVIDLFGNQIKSYTAEACGFYMPV